MELNIIHERIPAVVRFIAVWALMAQTGWFCPCSWRQRIFYMRATHLLTYISSHGTCALLCWQWVLDVCTPQWKYVTGFSKPDMVSEMQSVWVWKVLDGTNSWEECMAKFDEPRQILCGSSSFGCVRVPRNTWSLTIL